MRTMLRAVILRDLYLVPCGLSFTDFLQRHGENYLLEMLMRLKEEGLIQERRTRVLWIPIGEKRYFLTEKGYEENKEYLDRQ